MLTTARAKRTLSTATGSKPKPKAEEPLETACHALKFNTMANLLKREHSGQRL
jgi:hypothetical protein